MRRTALGHCMTVRDLFDNINLKKLKYKELEYRAINNGHGRRDFVKTLFILHFNLVIQDIILNNVMFHLPVYKQKPFIYLKRIHGEEFSKYRQLGYFKDVNFLESLFSGYVLRFNLGTSCKEKEILLDNKNKEVLTELTNTKQIKTYKDKYINDYYEETFNLFPTVPKEDIIYIINYGWRMYYINSNFGCDILINSAKSKIHYYCGRYFSDSLKFYKYYTMKKFIKYKVLWNRHKDKQIKDGYQYFTVNELEFKKQFISYKLCFLNSVLAKLASQKYGMYALYKIKNDDYKPSALFDFDLSNAILVEKLNLTFKEIMKL